MIMQKIDSLFDFSAFEDISQMHRQTLLIIFYPILRNQEYQSISK